MLKLPDNPILIKPPTTRAPLEPRRNAILQPLPTAARIESEMAALPHLREDQRLHVDGIAGDVRDARKISDAIEAIGRLPGPDEALHMAIGGSFALYHIVPAVLEMSGERIDHLTIATLGFSKDNIAGLCSLIDAGRIGRLDLLASHYFKSTSQSNYEFARAELSRRPGARFLSCRTHAKLLLIALADGRRITAESSANLRSCKNIETLTLFGSVKVFNFHKLWIDGLFEEGEK